MVPRFRAAVANDSHPPTDTTLGNVGQSPSLDRSRRNRGRMRHTQPTLRGVSYDWSDLQGSRSPLRVRVIVGSESSGCVASRRWARLCTSRRIARRAETLRPGTATKSFAGHVQLSHAPFEKALFLLLTVLTSLVRSPTANWVDDRVAPSAVPCRVVSCRERRRLRSTSTSAFGREKLYPARTFQETDSVSTLGVSSRGLSTRFAMNHAVHLSKLLGADFSRSSIEIRKVSRTVVRRTDSLYYCITRFSYIRMIEN